MVHWVNSGLHMTAFLYELTSIVSRATGGWVGNTSSVSVELMCVVSCFCLVFFFFNGRIHGIWKFLDQELATLDPVTHCAKLGIELAPPQ